MDREIPSPPPFAGEGGPRSGSGEGSATSGEVAPSPACSAGTLPRKGGRVFGGATALLILLPALTLWRFVATLPPLDLTQASLRSTVILDRDRHLLRPSPPPTGAGGCR